MERQTPLKTLEISVETDPIIAAFVALRMKVEGRIMRLQDGPPSPAREREVAALKGVAGELLCCEGHYHGLRAAA